jgi:3-oxoacyl-(acyl-carrier-protein) synthase III
MPVTLGPLEGVGVLGVGTAFPEREWTNEEALRAVAPLAWPGRAMDDEQLAFIASSVRETMGVERRAWAHTVGEPLDHAHETTTLDLATDAAKRALADAHLHASDVALVLVATSTPHKMTSTVSAQVGAAIGARAACMDVRTGCAGALFALSTAALHIAAGAGAVLVVGAETFSKIIPPSSKVAAVSLGDGAGALVLGRVAGARVESIFLETDGALGRLITTDGALPPTADEVARGGYLLSGSPDYLTATVPGKYTAAIDAALARAQLGADSIALFVPHQTHVPMMLGVASKVGVEREKMFVNVPRHANIGGAGWVVAFAEARFDGRMPNGARVLVAAVGGGMSWGAAVLTC